MLLTLAADLEKVYLGTYFIVVVLFLLSFEKKTDIFFTANEKASSYQVYTKNLNLETRKKQWEKTYRRLQYHITMQRKRSERFDLLKDANEL